MDDAAITPLATLFVHTARTVPADTEAPAEPGAPRKRFSIDGWKPSRKPEDVFRVTAALPIAFDGLARLEVDLLCDDAACRGGKDGAQHLADPVAYRRDRRKDQLLQENGFFVLHFLVEDIGKSWTWCSTPFFGHCAADRSGSAQRDHHPVATKP